MDTCDFSIVTVCRNAEETINKVIESVLLQDYISYEYIVIDGLSQDRTFQIAQNYKQRFEAKSIEYTLISESDRGIYDAMNKGIKMASGEYIIFMNADDAFNNSNVLSSIKRSMTLSCSVIPEIMVGSTRMLQSDGSSYIQKPKNIEKEILGRMPFVHQSAVVKSDLLKEVFFNTQFKISADYFFFLSAYVSGVSFKIIDVVVADYFTGGFSAQNAKLYLKELKAVKKQVFSEKGVLLPTRLKSWAISVKYYFRGYLSRFKLLKDIFVRIKSI